MTPLFLTTLFIGAGVWLIAVVIAAGMIRLCEAVEALRPTQPKDTDHE